MAALEALDAVVDALESTKYHWQRLADTYASPREFRYSFSAFIQEARNVTFRAQSWKKDIPNFDTWYGPWQDVFKSSALMRWSNDTRVEVTKRKGFEANSRAYVSVFYSYFDAAESWSRWIRSRRTRF